MRVLGIHVGHNASVFLLDNGVVKAGLSQEKLDNVKNSAAFPADAIRALLKQQSLTTQEIDHIAIAGYQVFPQRSYADFFASNSSNSAPAIGVVGLAKKVESLLPDAFSSYIFAPARRHRLKRLLEEGQRELSANLASMGFESTPRTHVEHHTCHARAAYHALGGNGPSIIFTSDGRGDNISSTVTKVASTGRFHRLAHTDETASVGDVYSATTRFLGMRPFEHEYKVMGLAPYAKAYADDVYNRVFAPIVNIDPRKPFVFNSSIDTTRFYQYLEKSAVGERFDNLAAAAQRLIEERVLTWIEGSVKKTGLRRAYFGGSLFMNVKLNMRIQELRCLEEAHFMPSCGDESNALGAAYTVCCENNKTTALDDLYLGLSYSPEELEPLLATFAKDHDVHVEKPSDLTERVAKLLADGCVVARFDGASEWGARSLGNRAILAHPGLMDSFYMVNDQIKMRDFWMPFAPTILDTAAQGYLENWSMERTPAPHMITAFQATDRGRRDLCAALHRGDGTLRPQVLTRAVNARYYDLIKAFEYRTGIGAVLNTSLNLHGSPLAATPSQALETLANSGLKYLMMGPFLIRKT